MNLIKREMNRLVKDEQGGEMLEYALIAGLLVVAAIAVVTFVGGQIRATWSNVGQSLRDAR
jgi:Flp pilus assembly pilin Flp